MIVRGAVTRTEVEFVEVVVIHNVGKAVAGKAVDSDVLACAWSGHVQECRERARYPDSRGSPPSPHHIFDPAGWRSGASRQTDRSRAQEDQERGPSWLPPLRSRPCPPTPTHRSRRAHGTRAPGARFEPRALVASTSLSRIAGEWSPRPGLPPEQFPSGC